MVHHGETPSARQLKLDAWYCKKFCVFLKRKSTRAQNPRASAVRRLLRIIDQADEDRDFVGQSSKISKYCFFKVLGIYPKIF